MLYLQEKPLELCHKIKNKTEEEKLAKDNNRESLPSGSPNAPKPGLSLGSRNPARVYISRQLGQEKLKAEPSTQKQIRVNRAIT